MLALVGPGSIAMSSGVNVTAAGLFDISGTTGGATIATLSGDDTGLVWLGSQTLTLSNASSTFDGLIFGLGGLRLTGGVETLTGAQSYFGPTAVDGGMLLVNGSIATSNLTTVDSGGVLGGTGTVGTTAIGNGGTLMPGLPGTAGGTLTIAGNLTMTNAATYLATVSPATASLAGVAGTAQLGGTLNAFGTGGAFTSGTKYTVLTATGGNANSFSTLTATGSFGSMTPTLSYDANDVFLTLTPADLSSHLPAGAPQNAINLANAITSVNFGTPPLAFQSLFDLPAQQLQTALTELSGEATTGRQKAALDITNDFINVMFNPYAGNRGADGGFGPMAYAAPATLGTASDRDNGESALGYAKANPRPKPFQPLASFGSATLQPHWSVWGSAYGGRATVGGNAAAGSADTTTQVAGYAAGLDYRTGPDTVLGFALGGGSGNWSSRQRARRRQIECVPDRRLRFQADWRGLCLGRTRLRRALVVDEPYRDGGRHRYPKCRLPRLDAVEPAGRRLPHRDTRLRADALRGGSGDGLLDAGLFRNGSCRQPDLCAQLCRSHFDHDAQRVRRLGRQTSCACQRRCPGAARAARLGA